MVDVGEPPPGDEGRPVEEEAPPPRKLLPPVPLPALPRPPLSLPAARASPRVPLPPGVGILDVAPPPKVEDSSSDL